MKQIAKPTTILSRRGLMTCAPIALAALLAFSPATVAQMTSLSSSPLASTSSAEVKPNVMFIFDTSGSMDSEFMPDSLNNNTTSIGFKNHLCNSMYYNPNTTYTPPKKADGSNFPAAVFTAAYPNGYTNYPTGPTTGSRNLSTSFTIGGTTSQAAYRYEYTGAQTLVADTGTCNEIDPNTVSTYSTNIPATGGGNWQKIKVTSTSGIGSTDERVNFSNWYQYYRTRLMLVKAAASRSFNQLTSSYRVGMVTIAPTNGVAGTIGTGQYAAINDFDSTQRTTWFTTLFAQSTHDSTPLREALARVGRHYAGKTDGINTGMSQDPVQYSCQQNFAILATDGYWNTGDEVAGPVQIDGSTLVGQQDGNISVSPRPMWDGAANIETVTSKSNQYFPSETCATAIQKRQQQTQRRDIQYQRRTQQIQQRTQQVQQRTQQVQQRTQQRQRQTEQLQQQIDQLQANTEQLTQRTEQQQATRTTTTSATSNLVLIAGTAGSGTPSSITGISIGGTARLSATVTSSVSTSRQARSLAMANAIALTGGFTVISTANCTGTNAPISGCTNNGAFLTIMAPVGSPTITSAVATSGLTQLATTTNSFAGGSVASNVTTNVSSCSIGTVVSPANVSTQTTACPVSDTGFVNLAATSCTSTGGAFNGTGARISCSSTTSGLVNLAATTCATSGTYNASGRRIIACNTVIGTFAPLAAATCTANAPLFNASGQRISCQTVISSAFADFASSTCTTTAPTFNASGQRFTCQVTDTGFVNAGVCAATTPAGSFTAAGTQITCQTTDTGFVNASTCAPNSGPVAGLTITCQTTDTGLVNAVSCSPNSGPVAGLTITCNTTDSGFANSNTCVASVVGGLTTTCQNTSDSGWSNNTCTASDPVGGPTRTCQVLDSNWYNVTSCVASNTGGLNTTCRTGQNGLRIRYKTTTSVTTNNISTGTSSTPAPTTGAFVDWDGVCYAGGAGLQTPPTPGAVPPATAMPTPPANGNPAPTEAPLPTAPCTSWPCTTFSISGGSTNSLADVAQYYYNTDLRPSMDNNVPAGGAGIEDDKATWQHMTTFTLGLGLAGTLNYSSTYKTDGTGDFQNIRDGLTNWPVPAADSPSALDDLWHSAVNGRGQFFSAADPDNVISALNTALAGINARVASAAAAATSNLEPVAGDNFAYTAKYRTVDWNGELEAHEIDLSTGEVKAAIVWSAQSQLDARVGNLCDNRTIYLFRSGAANNRVNFSWNTQACDSSLAPTGTADTGLNATEQAYFSATQVAQLSQYPSMTDGTGSPATDNQRTAAVGDKLMNFVRGQRGYEGFVTNDATKLYRTRTHVLGDIVNAQPVYVKAPFASYTDSGYSTFKTANASRTPMVYVAANDGMLHAFRAGTSVTDTAGGSEAWGFVPSIVLPNLYKMANTNYANNHVYSVDGAPTVGDFYDTNAAAWKTMLVAGLNGGGQGYYALDITDPTAPKGLWEFKWSNTCYDSAVPATAYSDCHIGYTFNNPLVSKLADGTWVVFVTSGYNNVNSPVKAGDGLGYLYVLRAYDGKILYKIATSAGTNTQPSGLNHIANWVDTTLVNNTTLRVYGGDVLGNLWRFDVNDSIGTAGREATLIGQAKTSGGTPTAQPITTKPELALNGSAPFIMFGTGRMLGAGDLTDTQQQSIYGVIDPLTSGTSYTDLRGSLKPLTVTQVGSGATATRTIACGGSTADCNLANGWVINLPDSGERINVDMKLQLGTLVAASNVPQSTACTIGGYSWLNFVNYATGMAVANSTGGAVSQKLSDSLAVGLNIVRLPDGRTVVITTTSDAKQTTIGAPFDTPSPTGKRISWREISQ